VEIKTRTTKVRITSQERKFVLHGFPKCHAIMATGNQGSGVGSAIKGYSRRGGKWHQDKHERHATTVYIVFVLLTHTTIT